MTTETPPATPLIRTRQALDTVLNAAREMEGLQMGSDYIKRAWPEEFANVVRRAHSLELLMIKTCDDAWSLNPEYYRGTLENVDDARRRRQRAPDEDTRTAIALYDAAIVVCQLARQAWLASLQRAGVADAATDVLLGRFAPAAAPAE